MLGALALGAAAVLAGAGGPGAVFVTIVGGALVIGLMALLGDPRHIALAVRVVTAAFLVRTAAAALLHLYLEQRTPGGAMFEDDLGYVQMAALIARIWRGEDVPFPVDPSIVNTYVRAAGSLFWLLGPNVVALKVANTVLAIAAAVFVYRTAGIVAGPRAALLAGAALLIWPSLGLWSALTLKESFSLFASTGIAWSVAEVIRTRSPLWLLATSALALPLQDTRAYLFTLLVALWPVTLGVLWLARRGPPAAHVAGSAALAFLLIANIRPGLGVGSVSLETFDQTRTNMAEGARSAFVESSRRVDVKDGDCFTVTLVGRGSGGGQEPQLHILPAGATLVYADRETTDIRPPSGSVRVRPGDVVCVGLKPPDVAVVHPTPLPVGGGAGGSGSATPTPLPTPTPRPLPQLVLSSSGSTQVQDPQTAAAELRPSDEGVTRRGVAYLPYGAMFLVGAPFPWDLLRPDRALLAPEMVLWYTAVASALFGLAWLVRARRWEALYVVLVGLSIAGVLSLAEGNLGTLVRHRGMLVPFVVIVAAAGVGSALATPGEPRDGDHAPTSLPASKERR